MIFIHLLEANSVCCPARIHCLSRRTLLFKRNIISGETLCERALMRKKNSSPGETQ